MLHNMKKMGANALSKMQNDVYGTDCGMMWNAEIKWMCDDVLKNDAIDWIWVIFNVIVLLNDDNWSCKRMYGLCFGNFELL